jgi:flagellar basal-body rod protein FlgF
MPQSDLYVALSAQLALQRRLDSIANNVANASTAGFRAEEISFEEMLSDKSADPVSFVSRGATHLVTTGGELTPTSNPLDVAINGNAWLAIRAGNGVSYTRDGRMRMTSEGTLTTMSGQPFLDAGGAPVQLDPQAGPPTIGRDGTISQGKNKLGSLGLFRMAPGAKLERAEGASVVPDQPAVPELDFVKNGVVQGFVEKSNVNPVTEMTRLIAVQRRFEAVTNAMRDSEVSMQDTLKALAGS